MNAQKEKSRNAEEELIASRGSQCERILARLKSHDRLRLVPVIVLTTTDDRHEVQRCYDLGCNVYITKPVDYDAFAQAIRQLGLFLSVMQVPEAAT